MNSIQFAILLMCFSTKLNKSFAIGRKFGELYFNFFFEREREEFCIDALEFISVTSLLIFGLLGFDFPFRW